MDWWLLPLQSRFGKRQHDRIMSDRNTHAASGGTGPSLDSAVQSAIALSLAAAAGLQTQVDAALRMVSATVTQAAVAPTTGDEPEVMRSLQSKLEAARAEARARRATCSPANEKR